jgi:HAD superfamily hydrolase (TIGR01509 family)
MIKAIFFDLGGVLVELNSEAEMRRFVGDMPREEIWRRWLHSPAVRAHEIGQLSADAFGEAIVRELDVDASAEEFMQSFGRWLVAPYAGALPLVRQLSATYRTGLLTNTCAFHWPQIEAMGVPDHFHHVAASFQVGRIKPDRDYFEHALDAVGVKAHEAIFFDDNEINCVGARAAGLQAHRVIGIEPARQVLRELALID